MLFQSKSLLLQRRQRLGHIGFLQILLLLLRQHNLDTGSRLINPLLAAESQNGVLILIAQRPRNAHLGHADALLLRNLLNAVHDLLIRLGLPVAEEKVQCAVRGLTERRRAAPGAGEEASGHRGPGD